MLPVIEYTKKEFIKTIEARDKFAAIEELGSVFRGSDVCSNIPALVQALKEREQIMSTGIGLGIAIPHAKISSVNMMSFAIGISPEGLNFDSMDGIPVNLIILVAAGEKQHKEYLRLLSNIMVILKQKDIRDMIVNSRDPDEIMKILAS